ncbi:MAG: hypothetical protein GY835_23255 [bacterium]|nr:hypothetical protein [bacterium]
MPEKGNIRPRILVYVAILLALFAVHRIGSVAMGIDEPERSDKAGEGGATGPVWRPNTKILAATWLIVDDDDNAPDIRSYYQDTLNAMGLGFDVWDTFNSDVEPTSAQLAPYQVVVWFTGDEFGGVAGPGSAGETALAGWLNNGGCLFISSQDYHFDRGLTSFMQTYLGLASATNDTSQTTVTGSGSVFSGLGPYSLNYPFNNYSDTMSPHASAEQAFSGNAGGAAIFKDGGTYRTVLFGFPFEAVPSAYDRQQVMLRVFANCGGVIFSDGFESGNISTWSSTQP